MRRIITFVALTISVFFCSQALAAEHGFINAIIKDVPKENVFRVNIEKIDGKDPRMGFNQEVKPGTHSVEVSLVFNSSWGTGMSGTQDNTYYKTISVDVESKKTYTLGARVNTDATAEQQKDGSFWEPIVYKTN